MMSDVNKDNLFSLLEGISKVKENFETSEKNDKAFNIFRTLHKEHDEVRLHSRFLAFLLSPHGSHSKGDYFLKKFLLLNNLNINLDNNHIEIYPTEKAKTEYNDIDILILNRVSGQAIIIENKIYAGESNHIDRGQIEGYIDKILKDFSFNLSDIKVIYLTINGHGPSENSLRDHKKYFAEHGINMSYKENIIKWLDKCIEWEYANKNVPRKGFLNQCLIQYQYIIKTLTNYINMEDLKILIEKISENEKNLSSAKLLTDNFEAIKSETIKSFWNELKEKIEKSCFEIVKPFEADLHADFIELEFKSKGDTIFYICHEKKNEESLYWGFYESGEIDDLTKFDKVNGYYRKFFDNDIQLLNFNNKATFNLISKANRNKIIEKTVGEIKSTLSKLFDI